MLLTESALLTVYSTRWMYLFTLLDWFGYGVVRLKWLLGVTINLFTVK